MSFGAVIPFHLNYVYMVDFCKNTLNVPMSKIAILNIATQVFSIIFMPIFGFLADKTDKKILMSISLSILIFVAYPFILYNNAHPSISLSIAIQVILSICVSMYSGGFFSSVTLLFPVNRRYTASGFSVSMGVAVFSFISSVFLLGAHNNALFLYSSIPMLLFGLLNFRIIFNDFKI